MGNKKNLKKQFSFENEIKAMKESLKKSIDEMPAEEFMEFVSLIMFCTGEFENEDWMDDEEFEKEYEKFYNKEIKKINNSNAMDVEDLPF